MQPLRTLTLQLAALATAERYLFTPHDLRALLPALSTAAFKTLLSRASEAGTITRICRGLYCVDHATPPNGLLLFHAAARLRADGFNYISLETALSDASVISQVPINRVTIMSSGRSNVIGCGKFGTIEFVHTRNTPDSLRPKLHYDTGCKMWRASVSQALRDMRATHRSTDLVDWRSANEFI